MTKIGDITLLKELGSGNFGAVYLATKEGIQGYIAAKLISKEKMKEYGEGGEKCLKAEFETLKELKHPNIYKMIDVKQNSKYYIILTEYLNGGDLQDCLDKYKSYFHKPFPEEIVQHLMRQIIDAFKYIHGKGIMHRDIKLENIMVNFDNENDKKKLNLLKSTVKIIDFGTARKGLGKTFIGTPEYMAPFVLKKYQKSQTSRYCSNIQLYDQKVDVWSLGVTCYNMLIGKKIYDFSSLDELIEQVEAGSYSVPTTLSREMVSFLNGMFQYDPKRRLTVEQLSRHPFLIKNVSEFTRINTERASKRSLRMNTKKNQTIWGIFKDEKQLLKVGIWDEKNLKNYKKLKTTDYSTYSTGSGNVPSYIPNNPKIVPSHSGQNMNQYDLRNAPTFGNNGGLSFYGQKMTLTHHNPTFNHSNTLNPNIINNIMLNQMSHGIAKQPNFIDNSGLNNPQSQYRPMDNDDSDEQKVCVIM